MTSEEKLAYAEVNHLIEVNNLLTELRDKTLEHTATIKEYTEHVRKYNDLADEHIKVLEDYHELQQKHLDLINNLKKEDKKNKWFFKWVCVPSSIVFWGLLIYFVLFA